MAIAMMPDQVTEQLNKATSVHQQVDAVRSMCKGNVSGSNKFAEMLILLSEVTTQLSELDETSRQASLAGENENAEARKWREISASTMKFAQASLLEQQIRAIEVLQDLSARGCSIIKGAEQDSRETHTIAPIKATKFGFGPLSSKSKSCILSAPNDVLAPPPGLSAPPGLEPQQVTEKLMMPSDMSEEKGGGCSTFTAHSLYPMNAVNLDAYDDSDSD